MPNGAVDAGLDLSSGDVDQGTSGETSNSRTSFTSHGVVQEDPEQVEEAMMPTSGRGRSWSDGRMKSGAHNDDEYSITLDEKDNSAQPQQTPKLIAPNVWFYPNGTDPDGRKSAPTYNSESYYGIERALQSRVTNGAAAPVLEQHKDVNNFLFGMKKWKGTLVRRPLVERSEAVRSLYDPVPTTPQRDKVYVAHHRSVGNLLYCLLFGWWLALVYVIVGCILWMTLVAQDYTTLCWDLAGYVFWPFGKYIIVDNNATGKSSGSSPSKEETPLMSRENSPFGSSPEPKKSCSKSCQIRRPALYVWGIFCVILWLAHGVVAFLCGFIVVYIPMAKIQWRIMCQLLFYDPLCIRVEKNIPSLRGDSHILMCTFQAANVYYYKYTVEGMNIVLVNFLAFVVLAIVFGYVDSIHAMLGDEFLFGLCCLSIIPLAYYIGMSIANISAQSNFIIGALLNATFGSIVEIILYYFALKKGLRKIVRASLTGTLLATMLFIPGLCMVIGGLKFEQQRFNLRSAGVSSSLLFVSVAGAYSPSLFQHIYGGSKVTCRAFASEDPCNSTEVDGCRCYINNLVDEDMESDPVYQKGTVKLVIFCSVLLPLAYLVGLIYTLRTHAHHIIKPMTDNDDDDDDEGGGHGHSQHGPIWSKVKSISILLGSTVMLALIAEKLIDSMQPIIEEYGIGEEVMGLLLISLLPDTAEIINGIQFARQNNIALSIEIGSSIAVQVCMLQIPILVLINGVFLRTEESSKHFTLIFPDTYVYVVLFSTILMNYVFQDGKSDYFQGSILLVTYAIMCGIILFDGDSAQSF